MADLQLGETMSAEYLFESGGAAYTTSALPFQPDYWELWNLTTNAENDLMVAYGFRGMTAAHAFATYQVKNDGANDADTFLRITANGFTFTTTAAGVDVSYSAIGAITGITAANPPVVTDAAHGLSNGDTTRVTGVVGMIEVNNRKFRLANVATNTFELQDPETRTNIDGSNFTAYVSGGQWNKLNRVDASRDVLDAETYTLTLGTAIVGADSDAMRLVVCKRGLRSNLGDIG